MTSDQPNLFDDQEPSDDELMPYAGTAGFVDQPASKERAKRETANGKAIKRARQILHLLSLNPEGLTYQQVGDLLNLHHGQSSGALSILHQNGVVFMLRKKINRCHVYVHSNQRYKYQDAERIDEPASTVAGRKRKELQHLLELVMEQVRTGNITDPRIIECALQLNKQQ
ncbi:hypothetical protein UFOVP1226_33 [uncultured Caudovirales phage]|uniref:Uncharacterized protein n=1 Tax=uncultured Caudovirales phage TaxID=2100421 RepID=A0A6J5RD28_9CAUD|nr:hypothetical protein UFOVP278_8 [uncultured Caudovirales phage]CAB4191371.1 hypothetical protein UFOVP1226_33 [uncultured Caudovirales phage]